MEPALALNMAQARIAEEMAYEDKRRVFILKHQQWTYDNHMKRVLNFLNRLK